MVGTCDYEEKDGYMECIVPKHLSTKKRKIANIILEPVLGFKQVEFSYRKYVSVSEKEV